MTDYTELKAELEARKAAGWRCTDGMSIAQVLALIAENETLVAAAQALRDEWRKDQADAERYRWLRDPDNQEDLEPDSDYLMPPIICGYAEHEDILSMDSLDKAIDAAMGK